MVVPPEERCPRGVCYDYLYYKWGDLYLCSAKAPVLQGSGSRCVYRRKGTSVDRVYVCLLHVSIVGCVTIRQKRIRGGVR